MSRSAFARLDRHLPGQRQMGLTDTVADMWERQERTVYEPKLYKARDPRFNGETRLARGQPDPGPYAPQLIRLVRYPFSMRGKSPDHTPLNNRPDFTRTERLPHGDALREALDGRPRPEYFTPTKIRTLPSAPAPRLWRAVEPRKKGEE